MSQSRIPLFPLGIVLLPGEEVPLHIFEPRYRKMTRECIERESVFGLIFERDGELAQTGCSALIVKTLQEYEDGRSDILTVGQKAFRLIRTYEDQIYQEADVEYLEEEFDLVDPGVRSTLEQLFGQCHREIYQTDAPPFDSVENISLAYHIAAELPLDVEFRQILLEHRSESRRQQILAVRLAEWYPQLEKRNRVREKAAGNGHGAL